MKKRVLRTLRSPSLRAQPGGGLIMGDEEEFAREMSQNSQEERKKESTGAVGGRDQLRLNEASLRFGGGTS
ncbi:unnamed protein product [Protopolystoma xenopodis]|uniref:Uncharacterized protein n=1 Tax=Protopolystoma xenopodis TaxID=117903 RepID=A0A448XS30_9PLAT|nr:unnamed protein product [Protopolystoma xenopodis]